MKQLLNVNGIIQCDETTGNSGVLGSFVYFRIFSAHYSGFIVFNIEFSSLILKMNLFSF